MNWQILQGDVREKLAEIPAGSVQCCVTSPPYWGLRDYEHSRQIGVEPSSEAYVAAIVSVFIVLRRVLKDDGTVWVNIGDSYVGGSLCGIPWRVALALTHNGWLLRSDVIWSKPNPMPESVTDRPTKAHEYVFLLTKSDAYYYNAGAIRERAVKTGTIAHLAGGGGKRAGSREGLRGPKWIERKRVQARSQPLTRSEVSLDPLCSRNKRSVWTVPVQPYPDAHFATYPPALIEPCILAGSRPGDTILDPFNGSGTTGEVAIRHQRNYIGIELNQAYVQLARKRIGAVAPMFATEVA